MPVCVTNKRLNEIISGSGSEVTNVILDENSVIINHQELIAICKDLLRTRAKLGQINDNSLKFKVGDLLEDSDGRNLKILASSNSKKYGYYTLLNLNNQKEFTASFAYIEKYYKLRM